MHNVLNSSEKYVFLDTILRYRTLNKSLFSHEKKLLFRLILSFKCNYLVCNAAAINKLIKIEP